VVTVLGKAFHAGRLAQLERAASLSSVMSIRLTKLMAYFTLVSLLSVSLYQFQKESSKLSIKRKRLKAAWDDSFRYNVLLA